MFVCVRDCQCEVSSTGANHHGGLGVGFVGSVDNHLLLPSPFPPYRRHSTPVEQLKFNFSPFVHKIELFVSFPSAPNKCDRKPEPFPTSLFGMVLVVFRQRQHYLHRGKLCLLGKPIQRWQFQKRYEMTTPPTTMQMIMRLILLRKQGRAVTTQRRDYLHND